MREKRQHERVLAQDLHADICVTVSDSEQAMVLKGGSR